MTWVAHDIRDQIVDFVHRWAEPAELAWTQLLGWIGLGARKFRHWRARYGKANEHNHLVPRDHWLEECPSSVYRVLKAAGLLLDRWQKPSRKGRGFVQPLAPHEHWHIDFSYVNVGGTFYYLCSVLDGCSRYVVEWDIREAMKEADAELVLQRAREKHPQAKPQIISDNGPQFVAKDFKEFLRLWQTSHVFTSPHYPQSNGKLERYHRTLKEQAIRPKTPLTLEDAHRVVGQFVDHYNNVRLHSALGYVTPKDRLEGRHLEIQKARDQKLEAARRQRQAKRQAQQT